ncbi:MAG TPA: hypothetical protein VK589_31185 [Chryseolinea sp.]|nr:hypothetical protein [Chryseolinea sp.]
MTKFTYLAFLVACSFVVCGQDEGTIVKRERIDRSKNIFLGFGPSFTLGENIGDYSVGYNVEAGFLKRVNRVLSIGPSVSYIAFAYDPEKTKAENAEDLYVGTSYDINGWHDRYDQAGLNPDQEWDFGWLLNLEGGNISLLSLALNLKFNLIPITDKSVFSIYGFAKPFISWANRTAVTGSGQRYIYEAYEDEVNELLYPYPPYSEVNIWYLDDGEDGVDPWGPTQIPALAEESKITGGIFVGPGVEFNPAKKVSIYAQAAFGYTFPVSYVSTESYPKTVQSYVNPEFPIVEKGFPSVNVQLGVSFNF